MSVYRPLSAGNPPRMNMLHLALAVTSFGFLASCGQSADFGIDPLNIKVGFGSTKEEVRYQLGDPRMTSACIESDLGYQPDPLMCNDWVYFKSSRMTVSFDEDRVSSFLCETSDQILDSCKYMGIQARPGRGSTEDYVRQRLGPPEREQIDRGAKWMAYPSRGILLVLRRGKVVEIMFVPPPAQAGS